MIEVLGGGTPQDWQNHGRVMNTTSVHDNDNQVGIILHLSFLSGMSGFRKAFAELYTSDEKVMKREVLEKGG